MKNLGELVWIECGIANNRMVGFGLYAANKIIGSDECLVGHPVAFEISQGWIELTINDEIIEPNTETVISHPVKSKTKVDVKHWQDLTGYDRQRPGSRWSALARRSHADNSYHHCIEYEGRQWRVVGVRRWGLFPLRLNTLHLNLLPLKGCLQ